MEQPTQTHPRPVGHGSRKRFGFDFSSPLALPLTVLGLRAATTSVDVDARTLTVRFGVWQLSTPLENLARVEIVPLHPLLTLGLRVGLRDRHLTLGTAARHGVRVTFHEPLPSVVPGLLVRHPGVTLTVSQPDVLAELLVERAGPAIDRSGLDEAIVQLVQREEAERAAAAQRRAARREVQLEEARRGEERARQQRERRAQQQRERRAAKRQQQRTTHPSTEQVPPAEGPVDQQPERQPDEWPQEGQPAG